MKFLIFTLFLIGCGGSVGSTIDMQQGDDAATMMLLEPGILPIPCDEVSQCTDDLHTCLGAHPEAESIDLDGDCVYLCTSDPTTVDTCDAAGGACVVLTGGLVACIPFPPGDRDQ